jgi:hypothetical protein
MDVQEKVRENRARRAVDRRGLRLTKSRRRDPAAFDYGDWRILDGRGIVIEGADHSMTLNDVERWLAGIRHFDRTAEQPKIKPKKTDARTSPLFAPAPARGRKSNHE